MSNKVSLTIRRSSFRWLYPFLSVFVAASLCLASPHPSEAIDWRQLIFRGIQVIQLSNISPRQEVTLGQQINEQLLNSEIRLYDDPAAEQYVDQIGQRLAANSSRPDIPYTFQIVDDDKINAFATMGGFVYVNTGLMRAAENEAELASVLAHEIGHIAARHAIKQMRQMAIAQGVASATGLDRSKAVQIGVELAVRLPRSREAEYEADQLGVETLGQAGYAQIAAVSFMEKLLKQGTPPTLLSSHPATRDRIAALEQTIDPDLAYDGVGLDDAAYQRIINRVL